MKRFAWLLVAVATFVGCQGERPKCRVARTEAAESWKLVSEKAAKLEHSGGPGFEELTQDQKAEHARVFGEIQKQAELVFQSFAFSKITWGTAKPARDIARRQFDGYNNKSEYRGFQTILDGAGERYEAAHSACQ